MINFAPPDTQADIGAQLRHLRLKRKALLGRVTHHKGTARKAWSKGLTAAKQAEDLARKIRELEQELNR